MISSSMPKPVEPSGATGTVGPGGVSESVGSTGAVGVVGPNKLTEPSGPAGISPEALAQLKRGAKVGAPPPPPQRPWDGLDPSAPLDSSRSFRMNAYDRALLAYLAGLEGGSVQKAITKHLRAAALAEIAKRGG